MKRIITIITVVAMALSISVVTGAEDCQAATTYTVKPETINVGGSRFDIRIAAKEKTWGYDTIQGACAYKGYAYMSLYNRQKEKIKIAKVDLKTMKVVKKSGVLSCRCHGDSLTYNKRNNTIVVCRGKGSRKSVAIVNASTLKLKGIKTIKISRKMAGSKYNGLSSIAYNTEKNYYIVKLKGTANKIVKLNSSFKPVKRIKITGNKSYLLAQSLYTQGNFMYDVQSFKGKHKYNLITVRNVNTGKLLGRMKIASGKSGQLYELENVFRDENQWYISFYRAKVLKKGDKERKNYLCKINVPDKLEMYIPVIKPIDEPTEPEDVIVTEETDSEDASTTDSADSAVEDADGQQEQQIEEPSAIEPENLF